MSLSVFERRQSRAGRWVAAFLAALVLDALLVTALVRLVPALGDPADAPVPVSLVFVQPPPEAEPEEEPEPEELDVSGQIVEVAEPEEEVEPEEADYLAEHDNAVEQETRIEEFRVNPEVLSDVFSEQDEYEQEDLIDLNVEKPSTGATVGNDRFEPDRHGSLASLPSRWTLTNREGLEDPLPSSHAFAALAGAPQNDLIEEELGERLALNTHEYLYAGYLARIRRMVNFYWEQNLRNLPRTARVQDTSYLTEVRVVIDANGSIVDLAVTRTATLRELDDAVTRAYHLAAPFPPPPEGLIEADGKVHLPAMKWTARFSTSQVQFRGVDPRAGELYPGIHKTPR